MSRRHCLVLLCMFVYGMKFHKKQQKKDDILFDIIGKLSLKIKKLKSQEELRDGVPHSFDSLASPQDTGGSAVDLTRLRYIISHFIHLTAAVIQSHMQIVHSRRSRIRSVSF